MKFFLDIDGVMVHANPHRAVDLEEDGFYKFNPAAVQILKSVLMATKDELILSTDKSLNDLPAYLKERLVLTNSYVGLDDETDLHRIVNRPSKRMAVSK